MQLCMQLCMMLGIQNPKSCKPIINATYATMGSSEASDKEVVVPSGAWGARQQVICISILLAEKLGQPPLLPFSKLSSICAQDPACTGLRPRSSKEKAAEPQLLEHSPASTRAPTSANSEEDRDSPREENSADCQVTEDHLRTPFTFLSKAEESPFVSNVQSNAENGVRGVCWKHLFHLC